MQKQYSLDFPSTFPRDLRLLHKHWKSDQRYSELLSGLAQLDLRNDPSHMDTSAHT